MHARELRFVMISRGVLCAGRNIAKIISGRKDMRGAYVRANNNKRSASEDRILPGSC